MFLSVLPSVCPFLVLLPAFRCPKWKLEARRLSIIPLCPLFPFILPLLSRPLSRAPFYLFPPNFPTSLLYIGTGRVSKALSSHRCVKKRQIRCNKICWLCTRIHVIITHRSCASPAYTPIHSHTTPVHTTTRRGTRDNSRCVRTVHAGSPMPRSQSRLDPLDRSRTTTACPTFCQPRTPSCRVKKIFSLSQKKNCIARSWTFQSILVLDSREIDVLFERMYLPLHRDSRRCELVALFHRTIGFIFRQVFSCDEFFKFWRVFTWTRSDRVILRSLRKANLNLR